MRTRVLALTAALALVLAACSGGPDDVADTPDTPDETAADGAVTFVGNESIQWEQDSKTATLVDGSLDVTIECVGAVPHNVNLEGVDDDAVIAECDGDDTGTGTVEMEPGTYEFYCSIPGHREAGMVGEIAVS